MLDVDTPKGQQFLSTQQQAAEWFGRQYKCTMEEGPKKTDRLDYLMKRGNEAVGWVEVKTRNMGVLSDRRLVLPDGSTVDTYLISASKLKHMVARSTLFGIPSGLLVYPLLCERPTLLFWSLVDGYGKPVIDNIRFEKTETQATCNGGNAKRMNAFLPTAPMQIFSMETQP